MSGTDQKDYFVSYNRFDRSWAEWIAWELEQAGHSVVIQAWDFGAGSNFVMEMDKAAQQAGRTIAVLSPDYLTSKFTRPEWAAAFAKDPTGEKRTLLPVRVRECNPDGLLGQIVYVDLLGLDEGAARQRLLDALQARAKPQTAPGFPGGTASPQPQAQPPAAGPPREFPAGGPPLFFVIGDDDDIVKKLRTHLALAVRNKVLRLWSMADLQAGTDSQAVIDQHFGDARVIPMLCTASSVAAQLDLIDRAMERHARKTARVIPILVDPIFLDETPFKGLQPLPRDQRPVNSRSRPEREQAWADIARSLSEIARALPK